MGVQRRWPFAVTWHRGLWRHWDELKPFQRAAFEQAYEDRATAIGLGKIRGAVSREEGSRRHMLAQRVQ